MKFSLPLEVHLVLHLWAPRLTKTEDCRVALCSEFLQPLSYARGLSLTWTYTMTRCDLTNDSAQEYAFLSSDPWSGHQIPQNGISTTLKIQNIGVTGKYKTKSVGFPCLNFLIQISAPKLEPMFLHLLMYHVVLTYETFMSHPTAQISHLQFMGCWWETHLLLNPPISVLRMRLRGRSHCLCSGFKDCSYNTKKQQSWSFHWTMYSSGPAALLLY